MKFHLANPVSMDGEKRVKTILLFPVDRDTNEFLGRLQSNVFNAASLFQITHVVH